MEIFYKFMILAFLFFCGCLIGWAIEVIFRRFQPENKERIWINPGFLVGPYLPLYGFGLVTLYLLAGLEKYIHTDSEITERLILFAVMAAAMTLIELVAGEIFIIRMHVKLWDYTDNRGNYKGIICPLFSFFWAVLGAVYYFLIHPHILNALEWFSHNLLFSFFIGMFYGVFIIDLFYSFKVVEKIRAFAAENEMVIRYEELKKYIRARSAERREKYSFILAFKTETALSEHLKEYFEKQREEQKYDRLNDFIKEKLKKAKER